MFSMRYAKEEEQEFWFSLDKHLAIEEFKHKVQEKRAYILCEDELPVGVLRYNLFWDNTPFLTLLYLMEEYRGKGFGTLAIKEWENQMRGLQYSLVMTSTQSDEEAQHFYRKIGYKDAGCLVINEGKYAQPMELLFIHDIDS